MCNTSFFYGILTGKSIKIIILVIQGHVQGQFQLKVILNSIPRSKM